MSTATWPSVVRMSAECINVAKAGVISRRVTQYSPLTRLADVLQQECARVDRKWGARNGPQVAHGEECAAG